MNSLAYIPGSDGAANASLMTVTDVRSPGATTIQVNTVANAPVKFYASMGTPNTYTDPITGETITVISEATAVDFAGTIDGSNVEIVEIAPGYTDNGSEVGDIVIIRPVTEWANNIFNLLSQSLDDDGTIKKFFRDQFNDFVEPASGVWSQTAALNGAMTAGNVWYQGKRYAISAIASKDFTASKDTYVDIDPVNDTATYSETTNNGTVPSVAADSVRVAKVVTNGSAITSVEQTPYSSPLTLDDVAKEGTNAGTVNKTNATMTDGASVLIAVTKTTKIVVSGITAASTTTDTEYSLRVTVDGSTVGDNAPAGAVVNVGSSRYIQRSISRIVTLTPGIHTIALQVAGSAGTLSFPSNRIQITTALAAMPGA